MLELVVAHPQLAWIAVWSVITFVVYAIDKHAAGKGEDKPKGKGKGQRGRSKARRVPEATLHGLALIGGFVGGWIARHALRHKTRKPVFALVLALATVLHLGLLAWTW